ncbi:hypothetical protein Lal_00039620 [Lupinus albus]|nr:hypothetical protein Lal_00039620 [Lupinus albus]
MWKDPKFGGGAGGTYKVAKNQTQHSPRSYLAPRTFWTLQVDDVCKSEDCILQEKLERKIDSLTTLVTQLAMNQQKQPMARVCGICTSPDHYTANIYNNRPNQQQQNYDPSSSRYNPGWRNHPNLKWSDHTQQQPPHAPFQNNNAGHNRPYVPPPIQQQRQQQVINNPPPVPSEPSLEELVRQMTMQNMQFQQETRASIQRQESSIQNLTTQMGQMATSLNTLQSQNSDKLPSQTVINPKNYRSCGLWDFGIQVSREMRSYLAPKTFWTLQVDDVCKSEDCILGNTGHLHLINPEIDRTYHRLVRQSRNLPFHCVPDSVSDSNSIFDSIPVSLHSVQYTDFVHSVALSDYEHSENSVHSENMAQPPTPPGPRERTLRELAAPDFTYDSLCIQYPNEDVPYLERKIDSLTTLVTQLAMN